MATLPKDPAAFQAALDQFTGSACWYQHPLVPSITYTDGVQYFAEQAGAYWLLDIMATECFRLLAAQPFLTVTAISEAQQCQINVTDGNGLELLARHIPYTDLIPGSWRFFVTDHVMLLPSEY